MQNRIAIFLIFIVATLCGCQNSRVKQQLDVAEAVMDERPDSALEILQQIDGSSLRGEPQARHALLLSQAYDKNYIDLTSDSLISIAVNHYAYTEDNYYKMLAYYYRAAIYYNAGFEEAAMRDALKSHDIAAERHDALNLSRIEGLFGVIYSTCGSYQNAYEWQLLSLEHAKAAKRTEWVSGIYSSIGSELHNLQRFQESLVYLDSAIMFASVPTLNILETQYLSNCQLGNFSKADSISAQIVKTGFQPSLRIIATEAERHPKVALTKLENLAADDQSLNKDESIDFSLAMAYLKNGNIDSAITSLNRHIIFFNQQIASSRSDILANVRHQHDLETTNHQTEKVRNYRRSLLFNILLLVAVVIIAILNISRLRQHQKIKILEWEQQLYILEKEYKDLQSKLNQSEQNLSQFNPQNEREDRSYLSNRIEDLCNKSYQSFLNQFSWIEKLVAQYVESNELPGNRDKFFKDWISKESKLLFSDRKFIDKLQELIEKYDKEILDGINNINLVETERDVLICYICGFSADVISILLKKSTRAIYNIKARIKKKLVAEDTSIANQILKLIQA